MRLLQETLLRLVPQRRNTAALCSIPCAPKAGAGRALLKIIAIAFAEWLGGGPNPVPNIYKTFMRLKIVILVVAVISRRKRQPSLRDL